MLGGHAGAGRGGDRADPPGRDAADRGGGARLAGRGSRRYRRHNRSRGGTDRAAAQDAEPRRPRYAARFTISAARSAVISTAGWMLDEGTSGNTEASTTRNPCTPRTRSSVSTTARSSAPMRAVPQGW